MGGDDAGQALIQAAVVVGQLLVIQAHEVEDGCMQVADVVSVDDGLVAKFVGLTVARSGVDAAAGNPIGEALGVVVAASVAALIDRLSPEFASPDDEGFLKQTALFEVGQQPGDGAVDLGAVNF